MEEEVYKRAIAIVFQHGSASIALVQRYLRTGYGATKALVERMESEGLVSPIDSAGIRRIFQPNSDAVLGGIELGIQCLTTRQ